VYFFAPWCAYCKSFESIFEHLTVALHADSTIQAVKIDGTYLYIVICTIMCIMYLFLYMYIVCVYMYICMYIYVCVYMYATKLIFGIHIIDILIGIPLIIIIYIPLII
jgi:hypothetical protein